MTRPIILAGQAFHVPALPLRLNIQAYPICRRLSNDGFVERVVAAKGTVAFSDDEMTELADLAFIGASAAKPDVTREEFDALTINPTELQDAFFIMRYQTGGWTPPTPEQIAEAMEGQEQQGEAIGA